MSFNRSAKKRVAKKARTFRKLSLQAAMPMFPGCSMHATFDALRRLLEREREREREREGGREGGKRSLKRDRHAESESSSDV